MVRSCAVLYCSNNASAKNEEHISFFKFPKVQLRFSEDLRNIQKKRREAWCSALNRRNINSENLKALLVCSRHFVTGKPSDFRDTKHVDWCPQLNMGYECSEPSPEIQVENYHTEVANESNLSRQLTETEPQSAAVINANKETASMQVSLQVENEHCSHANEATTSTTEQLQAAALEPDENLTDSYVQDINVTDSSRNCMETQTDMTKSLLEAMEAELLERNKENYKLRHLVAKLSNKREAFEGDDAKLKHYTGIPSLAVFLQILDHVNDALTTIRIAKMDNFQKLLLTLKKLRMNDSFLTLSYEFHISATQASICFKKVVLILEYAFSSSCPLARTRVVEKRYSKCFHSRCG